MSRNLWSENHFQEQLKRRSTPVIHANFRENRTYTLNRRSVKFGTTSILKSESPCLISLGPHLWGQWWFNSTCFPIVDLLASDKVTAILKLIIAPSRAHIIKFCALMITLRFFSKQPSCWTGWVVRDERLPIISSISLIGHHFEFRLFGHYSLIPWGGGEHSVVWLLF